MKDSRSIVLLDTISWRLEKVKVVHFQNTPASGDASHSVAYGIRLDFVRDTYICMGENCGQIYSRRHFISKIICCIYMY